MELVTKSVIPQHCNKLQFRNILNYIFCVIFLLILFSCIKEDQKIWNISDVSANEFLYNIPINGDTIYFDNTYGTDFRADLEGYTIKSVLVNVEGIRKFAFDTTIINSLQIINSEGLHLARGEFRISFLIKAIRPGEIDTVRIESKKLILKIKQSLSKNFIHETVDDGRLKISWPELDKEHTRSYLVERCIGEPPVYTQTIETTDSAFIDKYYTGERVNYRISLINDEGSKQSIWNYLKENEVPSFRVTQHPARGYVVKFSRCKYYNNFGSYMIRTVEGSPSILFNSASLNDTSYYAIDARFGESKMLSLICLPAEYPEGVSDDCWNIYSDNIYARYYKRCFWLDRIVALDQKNLLYTNSGKVYKYDSETGGKTDSLITSSDNGFLCTTPAAKYFYTVDENIYDSPIYVWPSDKKLSPNTLCTFQINFQVPVVSDNLLTVIRLRSNTSVSKLAIYNVLTGNKLYTLSYDGIGKISPEGQFMFIKDGLSLKLCSYINGLFTVMRDIPACSYYDFDPFNHEIYHIWDSGKNFMSVKISDGSVLTSYRLDMNSIINIDYYWGRIFGYADGKLMVFSLENGDLLKEIPAYLPSLIISGYSCVLLGNTIYTNHEMKYEIQF